MKDRGLAHTALRNFLILNCDKLCEAQRANRLQSERANTSFHFHSWTGVRKVPEDPEEPEEPEEPEDDRHGADELSVKVGREVALVSWVGGEGEGGGGISLRQR